MKAETEQLLAESGAQLPGDDPRSYERSRWSLARQSTSLWIGLALIAIVAFFGFTTPNHAFIETDNLLSMGLNASQIMLLAVGMTYVIALGELDLSVGSNLILSSVVSAKVVVWVSERRNVTDGSFDANFLLVLLAGIGAAVLTGALFGLVNAWVVTRLRLHSFIVTLATTGIGLGLALILTTGANVPGIPRAMQNDFGAALAFGVLPVPLIITVLICVALALVLKFTRYGLRVLAMGSDREAAVRAGISARKYVSRPFIVLGGLAGLAGFFDVSRFATTNVGGHTTDNLAAIAAVVIGGTSLFGGRATVLGSVLGSLIPVVLGTGLIMLGIEHYYQLVAVGAVLLVAVYFDQRRRVAATTPS